MPVCFRGCLLPWCALVIPTRVCSDALADRRRFLPASVVAGADVFPLVCIRSEALPSPVVAGICTVRFVRPVCLFPFGLCVLLCRYVKVRSVSDGVRYAIPDRRRVPVPVLASWVVACCFSPLRVCWGTVSSPYAVRIRRAHRFVFLAFAVRARARAVCGISTVRFYRPPPCGVSRNSPCRRSDSHLTIPSAHSPRRRDGRARDRWACSLFKVHTPRPRWGRAGRPRGAGLRGGGGACWALLPPCKYIVAPPDQIMGIPEVIPTNTRAA